MQDNPLLESVTDCFPAASDTFVSNSLVYVLNNAALRTFADLALLRLLGSVTVKVWVL